MLGTIFLRRFKMDTDIDTSGKIAGIGLAATGLVVSVIWAVRKALIKIISALSDAYLEKIEKRRQAQSMDAREELRRLCRLEMRLFKSADSFLHLVGRNGIDCLPVIGHSYTVKTYDGFELDKDNRLIEIDQYAHDITVDDQYRQMIRDMVDASKPDYVWLYYDRMPDCALKKWYAKEGILCSLVFFAKREENKTTNHLHYISLRWKNKLPSDQEKGQAILVAGRIKQKIRRVF